MRKLFVTLGFCLLTVPTVLAWRITEPGARSLNINFETKDLTPSANGSVATVWFFDWETTRIHENKPHKLDIQFHTSDSTDVNKLNLTHKVELYRWHDCWRLGWSTMKPDNWTYINSEDVMWGWNRLDVVTPVAGSSEPTKLYLNGRDFLTVPVGNMRLAHLTTGWFTNAVARVTDGATFRPNAVKAIFPENRYHTVQLPPKGALEVPIALDPAGAAADKGQLRVTLADGTCEIVEEHTIGVSRNDKTAKVVFTKVPRSGKYTLETEYSAEGLPRPDRTRYVVDVTMADPTVTSAAFAPIVLSNALWDFMPLGNDPAVHQVPVAVPQAWSFNGQMLKEWTTRHNARLLFKKDEAAWYRQIIKVPSAWKGSRILIDIDDPMTRATVFVNGKRTGTADWPRGTIDVTDVVRFGAENEFAINVIAEPYMGLVGVVKEILGDSFRQDVPKLRGLAGPVVLKPVAAGARIEDVVLRPHADETLEANFDLTGLTPGRKYTLAGEARERGVAVCTIPAQVFTATATVQNVSIKAPFPNPKRWEIMKPWLYDFSGRLGDAKGTTISANYPVRFGFRTIDWQGPHLKLNGRTITLFDVLAYPPVFSDLARKQRTFTNATSLHQCRGVANLVDLSEAGLTTVGYPIHSPDPSSLVAELARTGKEQDPRFWAAAEKQIRVFARQYANLPASLIAYGLFGGNRVGNGSMYNPLYSSGRWTSRYPNDPGKVATFACRDRLTDLMHAADPMRPLAAQDSGSINDLRMITEYPGWAPLQELVEMGIWWNEISDKPFLISEQAAPMFPNWTDACWQGKGWSGVPYFQEWSAALVGDSAYEMEDFYPMWFDKIDAQTVRDRQKDPKARMKMPTPLVQMTHKKCEGPMPLHARLTRERHIQMLLFNRLWGIGMISPAFTSGPCTDELLQEAYEPVTGLLTGPVDALADKTHIFRSGEKLRKGATLLNNFCEDAELEVSWKVELGGKVLAEKKHLVKVSAGEHVTDPIEVPVHATSPSRENKEFKPSITRDGDIACTVKGTVSVSFTRNGRFLRSDTEPIEVLVHATSSSRENKEVKASFTRDGDIACTERVALVDPEMETYREFKRLGIPCKYTVFDEDLENFDLIVFGRRAFNYEYATVPQGLDLGKLVKAGKKILILEQDEKTLRERFKFRTEYLSPRDVFARGNFPVDDALLRYWRGASTLTTGYEIAAQNPSPAGYQIPGFRDGGTWMYEWNDGEIHSRPIKWGNTHNVATIAIIKPDVGNFRTLADAGCALNYAVAMEYVDGPGRIVFNQFDVIGRTMADPAAEQVLRKLVVHATSSSREDKEVKSSITRDADIACTKLVVVDSTQSPDALIARKVELEKAAKDGATIFVHYQSEAALKAAWLPFEISVTTNRVRGAVIGKPTAPLFAGLGNADFYWKGAFNVPHVNGNLVTEVPYGKGRFVFCQLNPEQFGNIEKDHWLSDSKWIMERTIRTLLTNCGAKGQEPRFLAVPNSRVIKLDLVDLAGTWQSAVTKSTYEAIRTDRTRAKPAEAKWFTVRLPGPAAGETPAVRSGDRTVAVSATGESKSEGEAWIVRSFDVPENYSDDTFAELYIGNISGESIAFVNGVEVGITDTETDVNTVANLSRQYTIPAAVLKKGKNELAMRITWFQRASLGLAGSNGSVGGPIELTFFRPKGGSKIPEAIEMHDCEWWGHPIKDENGRYNHQTRKRFTFPGGIQSQYKEFANESRFWFLHLFKINEPLPEHAKPMLVMGAVDDEDITYVNNVEVGRTTAETDPKNYWAKRRVYPIDPKLLKVGVNDIKIKYHDITPDGAIKGPLKIIFEPEEVTKARKLEERPYARDVDRDDDPYFHHGF